MQKRRHSRLVVSIRRWCSSLSERLGHPSPKKLSVAASLRGSRGAVILPVPAADPPSPCRVRRAQRKASLPRPAGASSLLGDYRGRVVLGLGAHPDDLELGIGGTLARLSRSGARVVMAVLSVPSLLEQRKEEARRAAKILGCEVRFLVGDRCSRVEDMKMYELVALIDGLVKELSPASVFTHCLSNNHVDHKLVHEACLSSQRLGYFDTYCYSPTSCRVVNLGFQPTVYVDISETIELKMAAIRTHDTQFGGRGLETDHFKEADHHTGQFVGVPYAEGLEAVRIRLK